MLAQGHVDLGWVTRPARTALIPLHFSVHPLESYDSNGPLESFDSNGYFRWFLMFGSLRVFRPLVGGGFSLRILFFDCLGGYFFGISGLSLTHV